MKWSDASKIVGWQPREVVYPPERLVHRAYMNRDLVRMLTWHRFLPSPDNEEQHEIINLVVRYLKKLREYNG